MDIELFLLCQAKLFYITFSIYRVLNTDSIKYPALTSLPVDCKCQTVPYKHRDILLARHVF